MFFYSYKPHSKPILTYLQNKEKEKKRDLVLIVNKKLNIPCQKG